MRVDAHAHGMHAERDPVTGKRVPPVVPAWTEKDGAPDAHIRRHQELGVDHVLLLDPPEVTFPLKEIFGEFVSHCPQVRMHESSREEILSLMERGASGIKFIGPLRPYGDEAYFPLYQAVRDCGGLAVFHTGYQNRNSYDPGGFLARPAYMRITDTRPAELDRISRAFPDLKMLMAHMGNPWWEEAFCVLSQAPNIHADFSGGSAVRVDMGYWKQLFAPNGKPALGPLSKLCFGTDDSMCHPGNFTYQHMIQFYEDFYEAIGMPGELRQKTDRDNILKLLGKDGSVR